MRSSKCRGSNSPRPRIRRRTSVERPANMRTVGWRWPSRMLPGRGLGRPRSLPTLLRTVLLTRTCESFRTCVRLREPWKPPQYTMACRSRPGELGHGAVGDEVSSGVQDLPVGVQRRCVKCANVIHMPGASRQPGVGRRVIETGVTRKTVLVSPSGKPGPVRCRAVSNMWPILEGAHQIHRPSSRCPWKFSESWDGCTGYQPNGEQSYYDVGANRSE